MKALAIIQFPVSMFNLIATFLFNRKQKQSQLNFTNNGDYSFLQNEETTSALRSDNSNSLMWLKTLNYKTKASDGLMSLQHKDLSWLIVK